MERKDDSLFELDSPFLFAPGGTRLLQIQPTLHCNLRCKHCYSESGPDQKGEIPLRILQQFLVEAKPMGYDYVGVSGGEPLLWRDLDAFLCLAREAGYKTSVSTNATLMTVDRAKSLKENGCLVAVSVDGPPEEHNILRQSATAFERMAAGIRMLREAEVPFTLAFTLTRYNAGKLPWLYKFADSEDAMGVHIHPLSLSGNAILNLEDSVPDSLEFKIGAYLAALLIANRKGGGPGVIFDVIRRDVFEEGNWTLKNGTDNEIISCSLSELSPALIVEPDGCLLPFVYGFPRKWALGFLGSEPLAVMSRVWRQEKALKIKNIVEKTISHLKKAEAEYIDFFSELKLIAESEIN